MKAKQKITIINVISIIMLVICLVLCGGLIILSTSKSNIEISEKNVEKLQKNYTSTEDTSTTNTWDISATENDNVIATLSDDSILTISGTGNMKKMGDNSTSEWHGMKDKVKTVVIERGVTNVGGNAFEGCENLTSIEISESVKKIDGYAFFKCYNLKSIEIPEGVEIIGSYTFGYCKSLTSIEIPESVTIIGNRAFNNCESLTSIEVDDNNTVYKDYNGVLYTKDESEIIKYPEGKKETKYEILEGVTSIDVSAFEDCTRLTSIEIPEGVTSIGNSAFYGCTGLTSIKIPSSVTIIENYAFACPAYRRINGDRINATRIEIASEVTSIGNYVFINRDISGIEIPSSITSIGDGAFKGATITNFIGMNESNKELPSILKRAQDKNDILHSNFELKDCMIEESIVKIDEGKLNAEIYISSGKLEGLTYIVSSDTWDVSENGDGKVIATLSDDGTLTILGSGDMKDSSFDYQSDWYKIEIYIKNVIIENGVTKIGNRTFMKCYSVTSIKIPESVTYIGEAAFAGCTRLTRIEIPKGVTSIGYGALYGCGSLTSIEVDENNTAYKDDNGVLYTKDGTQIIKYPGEKDETQYSILKGVTSIGEDAFGECVSLTSIEMPEGVLRIEPGAFYGCYSLNSIEIPETITSIGEEAFEGCDKLTIICNKGSTAETYVKENEKNYIIMRKISPKTPIEEMRTTIESNIEYEIVNKDHEEASVTAYTATGHKIIVNGNDVHTLIVTGDCNGDGKSDIQDIFAINKQRLNNGKLTNEYLLAGDVNEDGKTNINDIFEINKYRLGIKTEL